MTRRLLPVLVLSAASWSCARAPQPTPAPTPTAAPTATVPTPPPVDTMVSYRVPAFGAAPIMPWGPVPPGTPHEARQHDYDLQHQVVRVSFDWPRHAVVGSTTLRVAALDQPVTRIALDAVGMDIRSVTTPNGRGRLRYEYDGKTLTVRLPGTLRPRARTSFVVNYEAVKPKKGAYFIDRKHVVWTQGETEDNRYWVPTYDYPNDRTTWEFYIRTPKGEKALSNGRLVGNAPRAVGDSLEWHWVLDKPNSTYLMTAVTGDFAVLQDSWRQRVSVGYWTYPDSIRAAWRGFGKTPQMIELFSTKTGVDYPWVKYDQVTAPDYIFGGMENVTATTQADDDILHPAWAEPQANSESLVSHELGHQWYGDYLTTADWGDVWLNEGFATFMEQTWEELGKSADEGALARLQAQRETIGADQRARRPLVWNHWVTDPLEVFFSGHIYPKGATILQMLRHQMGDSLFWRAMNHYTTKFALKNVTTADFERAMEEGSGRDLHAFFQQWVYGAGFPQFRVSYTYDSTARSLRLTAEEVQERDSLTGFFDADVAVQVLTDGGAVNQVVPVRNGRATTTIALPAAPRSIRWDEGNWLLDLTDFPRPTVMLAYQLAHDEDPLGRIEAVELLAERPTDPKAAPALARAATGDRFWGVRSPAVQALVNFARTPSDSVARAAALAASRDADSRVRQSAAHALGAFGGADVAARLNALATGDSSLFVRSAALVAYAHVDSAAALPIARAALGRDSWQDISRVGAIAALRDIGTPGARALVQQTLTTSKSRNVLTSAIEALAIGARDQAPDVAKVIEPLLQSDDIFVRQAAASALGELGQTSSLGPLQRQLQVEPESRVINEINAAIERIRNGQ